jgi:hypothetical protein
MRQNSRVQMLIRTGAWGMVEAQALGFDESRAF